MHMFYATLNNANYLLYMHNGTSMTVSNVNNSCVCTMTPLVIDIKGREGEVAQEKVVVATDTL